MNDRFEEYLKKLKWKEIAGIGAALIVMFFLVSVTATVIGTLSAGRTSVLSADAGAVSATAAVQETADTPDPGLPSSTPQSDAAPAAAQTAAPTPGQTPQPAADPEDVTPAEDTETVSGPSVPVNANVVICASGDVLTVSIRRDDGRAIQETGMGIEITCPDGSRLTKYTDGNGMVILLSMPDGEYTAELVSADGCVTGSRASAQIAADFIVETLADVGEVSTVEEVGLEETLPAQADAPETETETVSVEETAAELVESVSEDAGVLESSVDITEDGTVIVTEEIMKLSDDGAAEMTYRYSVGPNGHILYASGTESDVYPVEENGELTCGVRRITVYYSPDGSVISRESIPEGAVEDADYYVEEIQEKVGLFDAYGDPDSAYSITAEPKTEQITVTAGWQYKNGRTYYYGADGRPVTGLKIIDGIYYLFDSNGVKASTLGVDVSYFNGPIDWEIMKEQGIEFAIVRVAGRTWGTGTLFEDEAATQTCRYLQEARAAGLEIGAYVYSNAVDTNEATAEALVAVDILERNGITLDFPIYIDVEYSGDYPNGRADRLSTQQRVEIVKAFCETVVAHGYRAGIYSGAYYWRDELDSSQLSSWSAWVASYSDSYARPTLVPFKMWQFSSTARLSGCSGCIDMNALY